MRARLLTSEQVAQTVNSSLQSHAYWSGAVYALNLADNAWFFDTYGGIQYSHDQILEFYAWVIVRWPPGRVMRTTPRNRARR